MNKQAALEQMEPLMEAMQRIEQDIRDYPWMVNKLQMLDEYEKERFKMADHMIGAGTASYGIEATLPKAKYTNSDTTYREARKGLRHWERCKRYEKKIKLLEEAIDGLEDERERIVIEGALDGVKGHELAQELNVSRQTVHEIKRSAIRKLAIELYVDVD